MNAAVNLPSRIHCFALFSRREIMNYEIEMHRDNFKLIFVFVSFITQQRSIGENNSYTEHNDINMIKFIHQPVIEKKEKKQYTINT